MLRLIVVTLIVGLWAFPPASRNQDEKVNNLITQFLQDKDAKKRRLALLELEIVGPRAKGVLQAMSIALEKDDDPVVRNEIALALGRMGPDAQAAIPALAYALKNDKADAVREASAQGSAANGTTLRPCSATTCGCFAGQPRPYPRRRGGDDQDPR